MAMEGVVSNGAFTGATLAEKLTKLNVSQQSIESILFMHSAIYIPQFCSLPCQRSLSLDFPLLFSDN